MVNATRMKRKWSGNLSAVGQKNYKDAIPEVAVNPMEEAAKNFEKMKDKLKAFLDSGLWPQIMKSIPKDVWSKITQEIGPTHLADGVRVKGFKYDNFVDGWVPLLEAHLKELNTKIPPVTEADRISRMTENRAGLIKLKGKWRKLGA